MIVSSSSSNLCKFCRRKDYNNNSSSTSPAENLSLITSSKMKTLRRHHFVVSIVVASFMFIVHLADAQSQLPPGPSLVNASPFILDASRGPLSVECQIDYPEGDTDFSVDMSIEKVIWDANNKIFINKSICVDKANSPISGIQCKQTYTGEDDLSVKSLTVTFPASSSPNTYYAGNYVCKRRARRKGVKAQTEFVKFQVIDCLTNGVTELSVDGQKSDQTVDPISIHLTKEEQTKQLTVVCAGRTLNPGESANVKLTYQLDEATEPKVPQGSAVVEALSVVPADTNYAILAEERNVTVTTTLTFGLGDVGTWVVDCAMEQQPRCESVKTNKQIKIDVRIPKPIIECPKKVSPEIVPAAERKPVTVQPGQPVPIPLRANIRCNITDGKVHDSEAVPKIEWSWDNEPAVPVATDTSPAPAVDPAISNDILVVPNPRGYAAILKIDNVLDKHYRKYRVKFMSPAGVDGTESEVLGEESIDLTAEPLLSTPVDSSSDFSSSANGNYVVSPSSTAVRLGACLLLVIGAMFLQLAPPS